MSLLLGCDFSSSPTRRKPIVIAAGMLGGNQALAASRPAVRDAMTQAITAFEGSLKAAHASPAHLATWAERKTQWLALEQAVAERKLAPPASFQRHTELVTAIFLLNDELLADYGVLFDPDDVADRETLLTRGWLRLQELAEKAQTVPLPLYPLPEFQTHYLQ